MELLKKHISNDVSMHQIFFSSIPSKWICKSIEDDISFGDTPKNQVKSELCKTSSSDNNNEVITPVTKIPTKLSPLEYIQHVVDIGSDDNIIKEMICDFISEAPVSKYFTKKGCSMILEGITTNKWNINVCRFFSFIFDTSFIYRKQLITDDGNNKKSSAEPYVI